MLNCWYLPGQMKPLLVTNSFQHADTIEGNCENRQRSENMRRSSQLVIDGKYAIEAVLAAIHWRGESGTSRHKLYDRVASRA